jgi:hypothetical protein
MTYQVALVNRIIPKQPRLRLDPELYATYPARVPVSKVGSGSRFSPAVWRLLPPPMRPSSEALQCYTRPGPYGSTWNGRTVYPSGLELPMTAFGDLVLVPRFVSEKEHSNRNYYLLAS